MTTDVSDTFLPVFVQEGHVEVPFLALTVHRQAVFADLSGAFELELRVSTCAFHTHFHLIGGFYNPYSRRMVYHDGGVILRMGCHCGHAKQGQQRQKVSLFHFE